MEGMFFVIVFCNFGWGGLERNIQEEIGWVVVCIA